MPRQTKNTLSFAISLDGPAVFRPLKAPAKAPAVPTDADAQRALEWLARGKPQADIVHDHTAPAQDKSDLAKFRPASYRRKKG